MICDLCGITCSINPQNGNKIAVKVKSNVYCIECESVADLCDTPKVPKTKTPTVPNEPKPLIAISKCSMHCRKCNVSFETKCPSCGFKNPLMR